ncbi:DUF5829 family protein [Amycolatopsis thermoflava]|uniref:DUF5829 family protein n=1 Tax=Amycolatopsis thermoflava TaxID=84480 RepID=UPI00381E68AD
MGRETYLELFGVGDLPGQDGVLGAGGPAVSAERDGDLAAATERLRALGAPWRRRFRRIPRPSHKACREFTDVSPCRRQ